MPSATTFSSPKIVEEMRKHFSAQAPSFKVDLKYRDEVGSLLRKIDKAHKEAGKSPVLYK